MWHLSWTLFFPRHSGTRGKGGRASHGSRAEGYRGSRRPAAVLPWSSPCASPRRREGVPFTRLRARRDTSCGQDFDCLCGSYSFWLNCGSARRNCPPRKKGPATVPATTGDRRQTPPTSMVRAQLSYRRGVRVPLGRSVGRDRDLRRQSVHEGPLRLVQDLDVRVPRGLVSVDDWCLL